MTREEKCQLAIEKGFTYNPETGEIISPKYNVIIGKHSAGYIHIQMYDKDKKKSNNILGHQFAWYITYGEIVEQIDHINGQRNDNRICNLRSVTHQENNWNRTKAKGYYWHKASNKWISAIQFNKKQIHLGLFNNEDDARQAYLQAKEKYHKII